MPEIFNRISLHFIDSTLLFSIRVERIYQPQTPWQRHQRHLRWKYMMDHFGGPLHLHLANYAIQQMALEAVS